MSHPQPAHIRWSYVALAGIVAGAIDIIYAWVFWWLRAGLGFGQILQSVAAGLLGEAARVGGAQTAALGFVLHFLIALTVAFVYATAARRWPALVRRPWLWGAVYGVGVYAVMNGIVLPLSNAGPPAAVPLWIGLTIVVHAVGIGIPSALGARAALQRR
ncbi:MAG: hypothetical protein IT178_12885 [Acidobacteria bacterium]|nr:hypothetical protein [Acidobacteriota bacterium]